LRFFNNCNIVDIKSSYYERKGYDSMVIKVSGASDIGKRRVLNEDCFGVCGFEDGIGGVCVLADGMGGHNAGEVASSMAVDSILEKLADTYASADETDVVSNMEEAIDYANSNVYEMSLKNREQAGMGTTLVVAYVVGNHIKIANIGDSRAYLISNDEISRITVDHSVVEELVQRGSITREEARNHPDKNIITRALGTDSFVEADFYDCIIEEGESVVLCSDGLTEMVYEEKIKEILEENKNLDDAVQVLVDEANKNGGVDNITVVVIHVVAEEVDEDDVDR